MLPSTILYPQSSGALASGWSPRERLGNWILFLIFTGQPIQKKNSPVSLLATDRWPKSLRTLGTRLDGAEKTLACTAYHNTNVGYQCSLQLSGEDVCIIDDKTILFTFWMFGTSLILSRRDYKFRSPLLHIFFANA